MSSGYSIAWHLTAQRKWLAASVLARGLSHPHQRLCCPGKTESPRRERPARGASLGGGGGGEASPLSSPVGRAGPQRHHEGWPPSGARRPHVTRRIARSASWCQHTPASPVRQSSCSLCLRDLGITPPAPHPQWARQSSSAVSRAALEGGVPGRPRSQQGPVQGRGPGGVRTQSFLVTPGSCSGDHGPVRNRDVKMPVWKQTEGKPGILRKQ